LKNLIVMTTFIYATVKHISHNFLRLSLIPAIQAELKLIQRTGETIIVHLAIL